MKSLLFQIHAAVGDTIFVVFMIVVGFLVSIRIIPYTTDLMVNAAAGLAGKYLGPQYRTLLINCSTNNPELITMLWALFFSGAQGVGGIATPLGSNFANIYLIFLVALLGTYLKLFVQDRQRFAEFVSLLRRERSLVAWHVSVSIGMFLLASGAYQFLVRSLPPERSNLLILVCLCGFGVAAYLRLESGLRRRRADLFYGIDDEEHVASWSQFVLGTAGLMAACYLVNTMFEVSTELYSSSLSRVLGKSVFAAMHYFLGALITSLPELNVAISNYRKITSADLNTGLASASASNMSNLAIACIGGIIALFFVGGRT